MLVDVHNVNHFQVSTGPQREAIQYSVFTVTHGGPTVKSTTHFKTALLLACSIVTAKV